MIPNFLLVYPNLVDEMEDLGSGSGREMGTRRKRKNSEEDDDVWKPEGTVHSIKHKHETVMLVYTCTMSITEAQCRICDPHVCLPFTT